MTTAAGRPSQPIRAPRGTTQSCQGWPQEAARRMLMNNPDPDVAERWEDLVVYGGAGKAARDWGELADVLFRDVQFDADGNECEDFVLNQPPFRKAKILVVADNFGCGSSRESAVWTLEAYGVRSVIAPSLGDIFHENCYKNGLLPVILPRDVVAGMRAQLHATPGATMTVDLEAQTVTAPDGTVHRFEVDPFRKQALLRGQDEIALTLSYAADVAAFEARHARAMPWLARRPG